RWKGDLSALAHLLNLLDPVDERFIVRLDSESEAPVGERIFVPAIDSRLAWQGGEPLQAFVHLPSIALEQAAASHGEQGVPDERGSFPGQVERDVASGVGGN